MRRIINKIPLAREIYRRYQELEYERRFSGDCLGCFRGVYETFEEAILSAPKGKNVGYDNTELAQEYQDNAEIENAIQSYDYPVLLWLKTIFQENNNPRIFDFGGNVGIHFYTYEKYLKYPLGLKWMVCDLPEIVKAGTRLAHKRKRSELVFSDKFEEANGKDVFLASGSIQYVENLSDSISALANKPKYLLLNRLALYEGKQFVTLQNGGKVFYPSYVFNKTNFLDSLDKIGYEIIDIWQEHFDYCYIPFHPEKSGHLFYGMYFKFRE